MRCTLCLQRRRGVLRWHACTSQLHGHCFKALDDIFTLKVDAEGSDFKVSTNHPLDLLAYYLWSSSSQWLDSKIYLSSEQTICARCCRALLDSSKTTKSPSSFLKLVNSLSRSQDGWTLWAIYASFCLHWKCGRSLRLVIHQTTIPVGGIHTWTMCLNRTLNATKTTIALNLFGETEFAACETASRWKCCGGCITARRAVSTLIRCQGIWIASHKPPCRWSL